MSNVSGQLLPQEQILFEARQHWFVLVPWGVFILPILKWSKTSVAVTNKRMIGISGIFAPDTYEARLNKIASVTFNQSIMGRIFNYGDIIIKNTGGETAVYVSIADGKRIRQIYNEAVDRMEKTA